MCTIGRQAEIVAFVESLLQQNRDDVELIVVDQNQDHRLDDLLANYAPRLALRHVRIAGSGAARARNAGLAYATGDLIAFPDDDCRYLHGYLDAVDQVFRRDPALAGLTGQTTAQERRHDDSSLLGSQDLGVYTVHNRSQEFTIVVRRDRLGKLRYNECLGVGARTPWGADEGPDLVIRLIQNGCATRYFPSLFIYHPDKVRTISRQTLGRAASYARGRGCLLRLHRFPKKIVFNSVFRPAAGCVVYLLTLRPKRSIYYLTVVVGILRGLLMSKSELTDVKSGANRHCPENAGSVP